MILIAITENGVEIHVNCNSEQQESQDRELLRELDPEFSILKRAVELNKQKS